VKLRLTSFGELLVDTEVQSVHAEDDSGSFGILPRHVDFLTVLKTGVLSWRNGDGRMHHAAVRGGLLTVENGDVSVATREALLDDDLGRLESTVLQRFRDREDEERQARVGGRHLELRAAREILRFLNPGRGGMP